MSLYTSSSKSMCQPAHITSIQTSTTISTIDLVSERIDLLVTCMCELKIFITQTIYMNFDVFLDIHVLYLVLYTLIPKNCCMVPKICGSLPKMCGMGQKINSLVPKICSIVPKMFFPVPKSAA